MSRTHTRNDKMKILVLFIFSFCTNAYAQNITVKEIKLKPNPYTSNFNIRVSNPQKIIGVRIFDMLGRKVEAIGYSAVSSSMVMGSSLKPGMYMVQVNATNGVKSFKVVKSE